MEFCFCQYDLSANTYVSQCVQKKSNRMRYIQYIKTNYVATVYAANMHVSEHVLSFVILSAVPVPSIAIAQSDPQINNVTTITKRL